MIWNDKITIEINGEHFYYQAQSILDVQQDSENWTTLSFKGWTDNSHEFDGQDFRYSISRKKFDFYFNNLETIQQERLLKIVDQMHFIVAGGAEKW